MEGFRAFEAEMKAMFYRRALRPLLFQMDPEAAHERAIEMLATANTFRSAPVGALLRIRVWRRPSQD